MSDPTERVARLINPTAYATESGIGVHVLAAAQRLACRTADAAIRQVMAELRAYRPLSGWTGTPESFLDAFEREHLGGKHASTNAFRDVT